MPRRYTDAVIRPEEARRPLTVSELAFEIRRQLRPLSAVLVKGEVSGLKRTGRGNYTFTVRDPGAVVQAFLYGADARLMTPAPTGSLLPGITRDSLLTVAADLGIPAEEGTITVEQWRDGAADGEITEVFGCGTAAVVTPLGKVKGKDGEFTIGGGQAGPVTLRIREALLGIQTGKAPDLHHWLRKIA